MVERSDSSLLSWIVALRALVVSRASAAQIALTRL